MDHLLDNKVSDNSEWALPGNNVTYPYRVLDAASAAANDGVQNARAESGGPPPTQKIGKRLARTKERREENKGRKAGHPGRFHGDILQFLQQHVGDYLALPSKTDGGRNSALAAFWNTVHNAFWEKFSVNDARETMPLGADVDDATVIGFINEVSLYDIGSANHSRADRISKAGIVVRRGTSA